MKVYRLLLSMLAAVSLFLATGALLSVLAQEDDSTELPDETKHLIHDVRGATAQFHDLDNALEAGYGEFLSCFQHGPDLGMGQHYVNGDLLGDDVLDPLQPEALVYEPREDGALLLVAFEYIVLDDVWDPEGEGREPPTLFGQELTLRTNIPETPPVWALHVWVWTHNPEGLFADYNPLIICPQDQPITEMGME
jgi:hypothetical protein